jgi:hypothetical protein
VNHENIDNVRSLFVLSHAFSRHLRGFSIGTTIMMRDVGVSLPAGKTVSLEKKNKCRQEADDKQRQLILDVLNRARLNFSPRDLLVLAQPDLNDPELYWKSIEDFFHFMVAIAGERGPVSGQSLVQLFEEAKPSIMEISDFSNPSIPFERIVLNITVRYLNQASAIVIESGEKEVREWIAMLNSASLRGGLDGHFVRETIVKCVREFEMKGEQLFPHLLEYSPEQTEKHRELIKTRIEEKSDQLFVERSIAIVVPEIECEIMEGMKKDIEREIDQIPIATLGSFPFSKLVFRRAQETESRFQQAVLLVHRLIPKSSEFPVFTTRLRETISDYVKDIETTKRQQHSDYVHEEMEKQKAAREAQFQKDLQKMAKAEAEKRRKLEQERDESERRREEEAARNEFERQQDQAFLEELRKQQDEHNAAMIALQDRRNREYEQLFQRMLEERKASDDRARERDQEQLRLMTEREEALREQIRQLTSREPTVVQSESHSRFPWGEVAAGITGALAKAPGCDVS